MPHQNRVTPFGTLIATPARGSLLGNRGCLHDEAQRIRRTHATTRWIICQLEYKGWRRLLMTPGRWTELFFLDEATALAAGHRPCAFCSHPRFVLFRDLWAQANPTLAGGSHPAVAVMDAALHRQRMTPQRGKVTYTACLGELPSGTMVTLDGENAWLINGDALLPWQPSGYGPPQLLDHAATVQVLTPHSVVRMLEAGYPVGMLDC